MNTSLLPSLPRYVSNPAIQPAPFEVLFRDTSKSLAPGYFFLGEKPLNTAKGSKRPANIAIYDDKGDVIYWATPETVVRSKHAYNFRAQLYQGEVVASFTTARKDFLWSYYNGGQVTLLGRNYTTLAEVPSLSVAGEGIDIHESKIVSGDSLLVTILELGPSLNASHYQSGCTNVTILNTCFQELEISSGEPMFTYCPWSNSVDLDESLTEPCARANPSYWDFYHMNSIDKDVLGNYLISARHMRALYYISGSDGSILWTLGGSHSDFSTPDRLFHLQHDAKWIDESHMSAKQLAKAKKRSIALFDNENGIHESVPQATLGRVIEIDFERKAAKVMTDFRFSLDGLELASEHQGSIQWLRDDLPSTTSDNVVVGYGSRPYFAEFDRKGNMLLAVHFGDNDTISYRTHKFPWTGLPLTAPDIAFQASTIYVSWNGATEVTHWQFLAGNVTQTIPRQGFETSINLRSMSLAEPRAGDKLPQMQAIALDNWGNELARSQIISFNGTLLGGERYGDGILHLSKASGTQVAKNSPKHSATFVAIILGILCTVFIAQCLWRRQRKQLRQKYELILERSPADTLPIQS